MTVAAPTSGRTLDAEAPRVTGRLLTAGEVAELLAVPETWVREHTRAGTIPHVRLGRYARYEEDAVLAWVESCRHGGRSVTLRRYEPTRSPRTAEPAGGVTPKE